MTGALAFRRVPILGLLIAASVAFVAGAWWIDPFAGTVSALIVSSHWLTGLATALRKRTPSELPAHREPSVRSMIPRPDWTDVAVSGRGLLIAGAGVSAMAFVWIIVIRRDPMFDAAAQAISFTFFLPILVALALGSALVLLGIFGEIAGSTLLSLCHVIVALWPSRDRRIAAHDALDRVGRAAPGAVADIILGLGRLSSRIRWPFVGLAVVAIFVVAIVTTEPRPQKAPPTQAALRAELLHEARRWAWTAFEGAMSWRDPVFQYVGEGEAVARVPASLLTSIKVDGSNASERAEAAELLAMLADDPSPVATGKQVSGLPGLHELVLYTFEDGSGLLLYRDLSR